MSINFPLILVAKKEYLTFLQNGQFFMKNSLLYQKEENADLERNDIYDSAIKCGYDGYNIPESIKQNLKNPRLMFLDQYIKCFYQYRIDDRQLTADNIAQFYIQPESQKSLQGFNEKYALLISDTPQLVKQFYDACSRQNIRCFYNKVTYINDNEYIQYENNIKAILQGSYSGSTLENPIFIKREKYKHQQEFRFGVKIPQEISNGSSIPGDFTIKIGSIENISIIVKLKDICNFPICIDGNVNRLYIHCSNY